MSNTKQKEKDRLTSKALEEMREWLITMPLANKNVEKNLNYMTDFVTVVNHLQLPQNAKILELGAGSCWPSEWLYRMGFRTVSSDISYDMLKLGRERFQPLKRAKDNYVLHAGFVCTDAEFLPFGDATFDAVIIFNAFHHFPDFRLALKEINRILVSTGRLVFAEPGEGHATSDEAKREMAEHGVQEKEIIISEIAELAQETGFTESEIILHRFPDTAVSYEQWQLMSKTHTGWLNKMANFPDLFRLLRSSLKSRAEMIKRQRQHPCMILKKGDNTQLDSRRPGILKAGLVLQGLEPSVQAGHPFRIEIEAVNLGDTLWISQESFLASGAMNLGEGGYVSLGLKLFSGENVLLDDNYGRGSFNCDVAPGDKTVVTAMLCAPKEPGEYKLKLDLVDEAITWFEDCGSEPIEIDYVVGKSIEPPVFESRFPDRLMAQITCDAEQLSIMPGVETQIVVEVKNIGNTIWLHKSPEDAPPAFGGGYVRLGQQLHKKNGELIELNYSRTSLDSDINPGEQKRLQVFFKSPEMVGRYRLFFDMVDEEIAWFSDRGSKPVWLDLTVEH